MKSQKECSNPTGCCTFVIYIWLARRKEQLLIAPHCSDSLPFPYKSDLVNIQTNYPRLISMRSRVSLSVSNTQLTGEVPINPQHMVWHSQTARSKQTFGAALRIWADLHIIKSTRCGIQSLLARHIISFAISIFTVGWGSKRATTNHSFCADLVASAYSCRVFSHMYANSE